MRSIPYGRQDISDEDIAAVVSTLKSDFLTQGPMIEAFEQEFASYVGAKYCVAVTNGTAALHIAVMALGIKPGQKVITTPITFSASANCVRYCGGEVVFADIDPSTFLIDLNEVEKILKNSKPGEFAGIIPVDYAGLPVDLEALRKIADSFGLWILEDGCHAPGASFIDSTKKNQLVGNGKFAQITSFSFHPVKHITTGEGGALTTNDLELAQKLRLLRSHGITKESSRYENPSDGPWYHEMQILGFNYRLSEIHAALGVSQLRRADLSLKRRTLLADRYISAFKNKKIQTQASSPLFTNAWHLFPIRIKNRGELFRYLTENKIFPQVHYLPVYWMPYYQKLGYSKGLCPEAENFYQECISLPMYPTLEDNQQEFVIEKVLSFEECR